MTNTKKPLKILQKKPRPSGWSTSDTDEIERRRLRGVNEAIQIEPETRDAGFFACFRAGSGDGQRYHVEIRSLSEPINSCDCPDHRINGLGTCKHIEATLLRLQYRRKRASPGNRCWQPLYRGFSGSARSPCPNPLAAGQTAPFSGPGTPDPLLQRGWHPRWQSPSTPCRRWNGQSIPRLPTSGVESGSQKNSTPGSRYSIGVPSNGVLVAAFRDRSGVRQGQPRFSQAPALSLPGGGHPQLAFTGRAAGRRHGPGQDRPGHRRLRPAAANCGDRAGAGGLPGVAQGRVGRADRQVQRSVGGYLMGPRATQARSTGSAFFYLANYEQVRRRRSGHPVPAAPGCRHSRRGPAHQELANQDRQAVKRLDSPFAFVLTGTPLENRIDEIYSIVEFLDPEQYSAPCSASTGNSTNWTRTDGPSDTGISLELHRQSAAAHAAPAQGGSGEPTARPHEQHLFRRHARGTDGCATRSTKRRWPGWPPWPASGR